MNFVILPFLIWFNHDAYLISRENVVTKFIKFIWTRFLKLNVAESISEVQIQKKKLWIQYGGKYFIFSDFFLYFFKIRSSLVPNHYYFRDTLISKRQKIVGYLRFWPPYWFRHFDFPKSNFRIAFSDLENPRVIFLKSIWSNFRHLFWENSEYLRFWPPYWFRHFYFPKSKFRIAFSDLENP